jgi:restriction system protein
MARRKQKNQIESQVIPGLLLAIGGIWVVVHLFSSGVGGVFVLIIVAVPVGYVAIRHFQKADAHQALLKKSQAIIETQINPLVVNRAQLVRQDAYGIWQMDKWEKEKIRFIEQHIAPVLTSNEQKALQDNPTIIRNMIEIRVAAKTQELPVFRSFSENMTGVDFEMFCADELRQAGWSARVTQRSRDQGVDVIAEKNSVRVVLQCKRYAGSVGNKSVQEIATGRSHEQADYGVVVSNSSYTAAARQLASTRCVSGIDYVTRRWGEGKILF